MIHETAIVEEGAQLGEGTRVWHFAHVRKGAKIGKNGNIGKDVYIDMNVVIGDNCKIQNFASLYHGLTVGNDVFIGPHVCFTNDLYPRAALWNEERLSKNSSQRWCINWCEFYDCCRYHYWTLCNGWCRLSRDKRCSRSCPCFWKPCTYPRIRMRLWNKT